MEQGRLAAEADAKWVLAKRRMQFGDDQPQKPPQQKPLMSLKNTEEAERNLFAKS